MSKKVIEARYSAAAFQGMLAAPHDRGQAAKGLFKSLGINTREILFSVSTGSIVALVEGTAEQLVDTKMIVMESGALNLPLFDVPLSRSIMRPSIAVPRPSVSQTASD